MNELSLFSGAGGGLLASHLLGWRTIGYVENEDYCQRVIAARIQDGHLDAAPIFGDIQAFISDGYAVQYQGVADVVSGGFPCQPFSVAGKQAAADDPRNMWPATLEVIRLVRPRFAFLENVPGLLAQSHGYFGTILQGLAEVGYDAKWTVLSAADCGAPHRRDRLWVVASANAKQDYHKRDPRALSTEKRELQKGAKQVQPRREAGGMGADVSNAHEIRRGRLGRNLAIDSKKSGKIGEVQSVADATGGRLGAPLSNVQRRKSDPYGCGEAPPIGGWWATEPNVGQVADGVAKRVDRLKAIGNGQVPTVAATAWRLLTS